MPIAGWSPGIVPYGADETAYVVVDRFYSGKVYRETETENADLETVLNDLLSGQYNCPVRVVAFNTLEHWSNDVSTDVASEIEMRCDMDGLPVPDHLNDRKRIFETTEAVSLQLRPPTPTRVISFSGPDGYSTS